MVVLPPMAFHPPHEPLVDRLRRAEAAEQREEQQASQQKTQTLLSMGATVIGALSNDYGPVIFIGSSMPACS